MNRGRARPTSPARRRAPAWPGASLSTQHDPDAPERRPRSPTARRSPRIHLILAEAGAPGPAAPARPRRATIDTLAAQRASRGEWWDVRASARSSRRKPRSRFSRPWPPAASTSAGARQPDPALDETQRAPPALPRSSCALGEPRRRATCARSAGGAEARVDLDRAKTATPTSGARTGRRRPRATCRTGAPSSSATIALPDLPIGRHRLIVDGVACALTSRRRRRICPKAARGSASASARSSMRCGAPARQRPGDRRLLDAGAAGEAAGAGRRGLFRRQPAAHALPARSGPREPLSSLRPALPRSDPHRRAR